MSLRGDNLVVTGVYKLSKLVSVAMIGLQITKVGNTESVFL